jgi:hypothetical protein
VHEFARWGEICHSYVAKGKGILMVKLRISKMDNSGLFIISDKDRGGQVIASLTAAEMNDLVEEVEAWKEKGF